MSESTDDSRLIPKHGGYRELRSPAAALAVYDAPVIIATASSTVDRAPTIS